MNKEIPAFLIEMSKQMHEQDNRITAEPIWVVCYDEWLTCGSGRGDKIIMLLIDDGEYIKCDDSDHFPIYEHLTEYHSEWCQEHFDTVDADELSDSLNLYYDELPDGVSVEQLDMQKVVHKLKYCLTEADANWFIKRKQHDYPKLYTYVESMVYCPQMIELRNWILSLTKAEAEA
jgi:hypothetical protein